MSANGFRSAFQEMKQQFHQVGRRCFSVFRLLLLFSAMASSSAWAGNHGAELPNDGAAYWTANCASCHGATASPFSRGGLGLFQQYFVGQVLG
jgi:mono/diheme cytochrome c family protein